MGVRGLRGGPDGTRPTPPHRHAKLLAPTEDGRAAIAKIGPGHAADRLADALGENGFA